MAVGGDVAALLPEEAACIGRSVPTRAQEFAAGRQCARRALQEFGIEDFPLLVGERREPLWPEGIVGSITHTAGICAVAVGERRCFAGIGLDIEIAGRVKRELWPKICVAEEMAWLASLGDSERAGAATLVFAAKEAFYKSQYPVAREWVYFHDVRIDLPAWGAARASFAVQPLRALKVSEMNAAPLRGEFAFMREFLAAGIAISAT